VRHAWLTDLIRQVHAASNGVYGSRRVRAELMLGRGITVSHGAVEMLMKRAGITGLPGRKQRPPRPDTATATDLVDRDFVRTAPNQLWITDIAEHRIHEGKVYCAVVLDAFSRKVVGWSIDSRQDAALVTNALGMAPHNRETAADTVIHSDHAVQYTSWAFTLRAKESGLLPSMGSIGDCYDNGRRTVRLVHDLALDESLVGPGGRHPDETRGPRRDTVPRTRRSRRPPPPPTPAGSTRRT
jgi:transposase InsO family protein